jgi:hypothetical protein
VDIRRAQHEEIAAAVSVWATANRRPPTGGHADRLRLWSEQDGSRLFIVVNERAIRLFESLGFQATGRAMLDDDGAELVLLELLLSSRWPQLRETPMRSALLDLSSSSTLLLPRF